MICILVDFYLEVMGVSFPVAVTHSAVIDILVFFIDMVLEDIEKVYIGRFNMIIYCMGNCVSVNVIHVTHKHC